MTTSSDHALKNIGLTMVIKTKGGHQAKRLNLSTFWLL